MKQRGNKSSECFPDFFNCQFGRRSFLAIVLAIAYKVIKIIQINLENIVIKLVQCFIGVGAGFGFIVMLFDAELLHEVADTVSVTVSDPVPAADHVTEIMLELDPPFIMPPEMVQE